MPNWTANQLLITGDKEKVEACLKAIANDKPRMAIDFNKIVPMPAILLNVKKGSAEFTHGPSGNEYPVPIRVENWMEDENGKKRMINGAEQAAIKATGFNDWYDWAIENWGTKWNASEATAESIMDGEAEIRFDTAWAPPAPILEALRKQYPELTFELNYKNEDDAEFPHSL